MPVSFVVAPYHLGRPGAGMALGPDRILEALAAPRAGRAVVAPPVANSEVAASFAVAASIAEAVRAAAASGALPVVLSGNCLAAVGTVAGIAASRVGIVWLDAHGDFNTAATTPTGYVDGMALAVAAGREWPRLAALVPGFAVVDPRNVVHVGGRDFDPGEREELVNAGAAAVSTEAVRAGRLGPALEVLAARVDAVYLHLDVDVLDVTEGRANAYASPGGPTAAQFAETVELCMATLPVRAVGVAAYDPAFDPEGRIAAIAATAVRAIEARVAS